MTFWFYYGVGGAAKLVHQARRLVLQLALRLRTVSKEVSLPL